MAEKVITIATYGDPIEAHLARSKLLDAGIEALVVDENTQALYGYNNPMFGGAKLQVRESDAQRALEVLGGQVDTLEPWEQSTDDAFLTAEPPAEAPGPDSEQNAEEPDVDPEAICPRCGSAMVHCEKFSLTAVLLSLPLLGIPLQFIKRWWTCEDCGTRWKGRW